MFWMVLRIPFGWLGQRGHSGWLGHLYCILSLLCKRGLTGWDIHIIFGGEMEGVEVKFDLKEEA